MAFFQPPEGCAVPAQPQPAYPMVVPQQPVYVSPSQPYSTAFQSPAAASTAQWAAQCQWRWTSPSPSATALSAGQYVYPALQALPAEMYTTQPPPTEPPMMEATPAEGSMVMDPSMAQPHYVEGQNVVYATPSVATSVPAQPTPIHTSPSTIVTAVPQRTPIAYKRPIAATATRKIIGTPTACSVAYSPRATPPAKIMAGQGQQRMIPRTVSSLPTTPVSSRHHTDYVDGSESGGPLTPPPTPDVLAQ